MTLALIFLGIGLFIGYGFATHYADKKISKMASAFDVVEYEMRLNGHEDAAKIATATYIKWMKTPC